MFCSVDFRIQAYFQNKTTQIWQVVTEVYGLIFLITKHYKMQVSLGMKVNNKWLAYKLHTAHLQQMAHTHTHTFNMCWPQLLSLSHYKILLNVNFYRCSVQTSLVCDIAWYLLYKSVYLLIYLHTQVLLIHNVLQLITGQSQMLNYTVFQKSSPFFQYN